MWPGHLHQRGDGSIAAHEGVVVHIDIVHPSVADELATNRIVTGQVGCGVAADPDPAPVILVHTAREGGCAGMNGPQILQGVLGWIEAQQMASIGRTHIKPSDAAHKRCRGEVRARHLGNELPELAGFRVDLQDEEVLRCLAHDRVETGRSLMVVPSVEMHPVDGPYRNSEIARGVAASSEAAFSKRTDKVAISPRQARPHGRCLVGSWNIASPPVVVWMEHCDPTDRRHILRRHPNRSDQRRALLDSTMPRAPAPRSGVVYNGSRFFSVFSSGPTLRRLTLVAETDRRCSRRYSWAAKRAIFRKVFLAGNKTAVFSVL